MTDESNDSPKPLKNALIDTDKLQPGRRVSVDGQKIYPKVEPTSKNDKVKHSGSKLRSLVSLLIGGLAVYLIVAAVVLAWAKQTLLNTDSFVSTVTAVARQPDVHKFAGQKISQAISDNAPSSELIKRLVPDDQQSSLATLSPDQLKNDLRPYVELSVNQVIASPEFINFWENTSRNIHGQLINVLQTAPLQARIDLSSTIDDLVKLLQSSPALSFIDTNDLSKPEASFDIKPEQLETLRRGYLAAERYGLLVAIMAAVVAVAAAIAVANRRLRTLRRILVFTIFSMLLLVLLITLPSRFHPNVVDPATWAAAVSVFQTLFGGLAKLSIVFALICLTALAFSFLVPALIKRPTKTTTSSS